MDCASCVGKIETALARLSGVSDVSVNFTSETLSLTRDATGGTTANVIAEDPLARLRRRAASRVRDAPVGTARERQSRPPWS
jgi:copper chaperone CopZ